MQIKDILKYVGKNIEKIGLIFSLFVSIIAIIISIRSCNDSHEALELSRKEFQSKRVLVLESKNGYISPGFVFQPFDANHKLQRVIVYFPNNISKNEIFVEPPDYQFILTEIEDSLNQILKKTSRTYVKNNGLNIPSVLVPIIVKSNYIVGGENLWDTSLYNLEFTYHFNSNIESESYLDFKNLMFVGKWPDEENFGKALNKFWSSNFDELLKKLNNM